jgi:hypothetical protein
MNSSEWLAGLMKKHTGGYNDKLRGIRITKDKQVQYKMYLEGEGWVNKSIPPVEARRISEEFSS